MADFIRASGHEVRHSEAYTRPQIVDAYASWEEFSAAESELLSTLLPQTSKVLDLGCGTGRASLMVPEDADYVGVDISNPMILRAKEKYPGRKFVYGDIIQYAAMTSMGTFDCVMLLNNVIDMLHPWGRRETLLAEVRRLLSPNGNLIMSSHILTDSFSERGYYKEMYHGSPILVYRSRHSSLIRELEDLGYRIYKSLIDCRDTRGDWVYIHAKVHQ